MSTEVGSKRLDVAVIREPKMCAMRKRRISPEAGRALEKLGHAIEYLTDEYVHERGTLSAHDPRIATVQLLMVRNREVYFSCPVIPGYGERIGAVLRGIFGRMHVHHPRWIFR